MQDLLMQNQKNEVLNFSYLSMHRSLIIYGDKVETFEPYFQTYTIYYILIISIILVFLKQYINVNVIIKKSKKFILLFYH